MTQSAGTPSDLAPDPGRRLSTGEKIRFRIWLRVVLAAMDDGRHFRVGSSATATF